MSGMWKRSPGLSIATPPDERGGNSCDGPTATATSRLHPTDVSLENMGATESNTCSGEILLELG
jgi:hypothetical protein